MSHGQKITKGAFRPLVPTNFMCLTVRVLVVTIIFFPININDDGNRCIDKAYSCIRIGPLQHSLYVKKYFIEIQQTCME